MEEGEEVFIPEDIKMEVLNRMFNSIQRRTQLHDTRVFPAELADEFIDSPFLSGQQSAPSSHSHAFNNNQNSTLTPTHTPTLNEVDEQPLPELSPAVDTQVVEATSIEELLQRGASMAESSVPTAYRPAMRPVGAAANAEDLESFLLHQAMMRSE